MASTIAFRIARSCRNALAACAPRRAAAPLLAAFCGMAAPPAAAGPWPREEGTAFVAITPALAEAERRSGPATNFDSFYVEWGLGGDATFAADFYREGFGEEPWSGMVSLRRLLGQDDAGTLFSAELGMGLLAQPESAHDLRLRAGLSLGRGFGSSLGPGWTSLDLSFERRENAQDRVMKIDATLGLRPAPRSMLILQLFHETRTGAGTGLKLAPSTALEVTEGMTLQLAGEMDLQRPEDAEMRVKIWLNF